jgi:hypothetical protein
MYNQKFTDEIMQHINDFSNWMNKLIIVSYDDKTMREMVSRYEELVPELRDYHIEFNEDSIMKLISLLPLMMQYFDPAPAAKTRVIKKYVSEEKMAEYAMILKGSFEEIKASLEAAFPGIIAKIKENSEKNLLSEADQVKYKFTVIREAQKLCMKHGKISMSKAIRDYLKNHTGEDAFNLDEEGVESLKNGMSYVNKFFEWICEHEKDILKEVAFYMSKEELLKDTIREEYSDPTPELPEHPTMADFFAAVMKSSIESAKFKYTKTYDEYLEGKVKVLIVALGGTLEEFSNNEGNED